MLVVKNPPPSTTTTNVGDLSDVVWPLGQEDSLEDSMATHSNILSWRIPQTEEPSGLQSSPEFSYNNFHTICRQFKIMRVFKQLLEDTECDQIQGEAIGNLTLHSGDDVAVIFSLNSTKCIITWLCQFHKLLNLLALCGRTVGARSAGGWAGKIFNSG